MLGSDIDYHPWPDCGEIDIMEYVGRNPGEVFITIHSRSSHGNLINTKTISDPGIENGFYVFKADWTKDYISIYLDDKKLYTYRPNVKNNDTWPLNRSFYFILNVAIGGVFGGPVGQQTKFPQNYLLTI